MSLCVLDASCVAPWLFKDEASAASIAMLSVVTDFGAIVPALWHVEVANLLGMGERRGRLDRTDIPAALALLSSLDLETEALVLGARVDAVLDLVRTYRLTAYDATYLEIAMRRVLPLATNDGELRKAAGLAGVGLVGTAP